ncbi:MAG: ABC transporter substrate-binding protein [Chloroflexi bacterium]|nr:ABC transporter substrate-binding protein [Chloroflexota bacterium]
MSDESRHLSRRRLLRLSALLAASGGAGAAIAACGGAPASPTAAPKAAATTAPAAAAKPTEAAKPAAGATTAPAAAKPTEAAKPAAGATTAPAAATKPGGVKFVEIITDPAMAPKAFKESPMLAELVKAGKLPAVEQRLPSEPLVYKPNEIGKYGGTWRMGFTGPADGQNMDRHMHELILYWDPLMQKVVPHLAKSFEVSPDGMTTTLHLRKGLKWSDGKPFTSADIMFWYEDLYGNAELNPSKASFMAIKGEQGTVEAPDELTVRFKFKAPYFSFPELIASLGGSSHFQAGRDAMGLYSPKHYMQQFHPKYAPKEQIEAKAKEAKFDNWVLYFKNRNDPKLNVDCPTVAPWRTTSPINTPTMQMERNPYYFAVDTDGNQLPYIDKITFGLAENLEVLNLRAIAGEYDLQVRHIDIAKVPVFKQNEQKAGYAVKFWQWQHGTDAGFFINQSYDADPEIAKLLTNKEFRIALSLGIDRAQLNEVFWLGLGDPGSVAPGDKSPYYLGPEGRKKNSVLDVKKANEMLDALGLKKDGEGFRLRGDGKRLALEVTTVGAAFVNWTGIGQMVAEQWGKNLGVKANVTQVERSLMETRMRANELQIRVWSNDGSDNPYTYPPHAMAFSQDSAMGVEYGKWYQSGGKLGRKPEGDILKQLELLDQGKAVPPDKRIDLGKQLLQLSVDNVWIIGTVGVSPALLGVVVQSNKMGNVPDGVVGSTPGQTPGNARTTTFFFKS